MKTNNWEKEWREKYDLGSWVAPNGQRYPYSEIYGFINSLLTKKDQEHKAELEMIKGEITSGIGYGNFGFSNDKGEICIKLKDIQDILHSHINKTISQL